MTVQTKRMVVGESHLYVEDDQFVAQWKPEAFSFGLAYRGSYIYGRDYSEFPETWDARSWSKWTVLDSRSGEFNNLITNRLSISELRFALNFHPEVEKILTNGTVLKDLSARSSESYLSKLPILLADTPEIISSVRDTLDVMKSFLLSGKNNKWIISLDALEGTPFLLGLIHVINSEPSCQWIIFGPERYALQFDLLVRERPYLTSGPIVELFRDASRTSMANATERFEAWLATGFAQPSRRGLTLAQANQFMGFALSKSGSEELIDQMVPPQIAAPLNVRIQNDVLDRAEVTADFLPDEEAIRSSCDHLSNLIGDIVEAAYLSNWSPGAQRKLERVREEIALIKEPELRTISSITQFGLDLEALRQVFEGTKDELSDSAIDEFVPLFLHGNLLLGQFPAWRQFLENAERLNWGRHVSGNYVAALKELYVSLSNADVGIGEGVAAYAGDVAMAESTGPNVVGASSSARNILSVVIRYLLSLRDRAAKGAGDALGEATRDLSKSALQRLFAGLGHVVLTLARENPTYFGWVAHAAKLLGWN